MPYSDDPNNNRAPQGGNRRSGAPPPPPSGASYGNTGVGPGQRPPQRGSARYPTQQQAPPPGSSSSTEPRPLVNNNNNNNNNRDNVESEDGGSDMNSYEDEPRDDDDYDDDDDDAPEQPRRREHKYSSANMERGDCRKYLCIALLFIVFLAFSIGLSILINKLFFAEDDAEGTGQPDPYQNENSTFQRDKAYVDTACGASTYDQDGGTKCKEVCEPQYSECCRAFLPADIYADANGTGTNGTNATSPATSPIGGGEEDRSTDETCSLSTEPMGCQSYSKCIAAVGIDPAPAALPVYCGEPRISEDRETCEDICNLHRCCYAEDDRMHCRADKLDVCLDYASCQNLRNGPVLVTAPYNLDQYCYQQTPECDAMCKKAECCNVNHTNSCFQTDFVSCLTYAACNYSPFAPLNITIAPQFGVLPQLPVELDAACNERHSAVYQPEEDPQSCRDLCKVAACCNDEDPAKNCFKLDPLGCLAWDQQCQVNRFQ